MGLWLMVLESTFVSLSLFQLVLFDLPAPEQARLICHADGRIGAAGRSRPRRQQKYQGSWVGVFSRTTHCNLPSKSDSAKGAVSVNTWGHAWDEIVIRLHRSLLIHFNDFSLQTVCRDMSSDGSCYMFPSDPERIENFTCDPSHSGVAEQLTDKPRTSATMQSIKGLEIESYSRKG